MLRTCVIMAGGSGERFWPLSRKNRPKQLLPLTESGKTLLEEAVDRIRPLISPEHVYIVTGEHLVDPIRHAQVGVPAENVIAEPCKRNTLGALAFAAAHLLARYGGDGTNLGMAVLTADHQIGDSDRFRALVDAAMTAAEREDALVVHGIVPTRPETGYGYVKMTDGERLGGFDDTVHIHPVEDFLEKPDQARAEQFASSGRHFWNGGMFFWQISTFLSELGHARPQLGQAVEGMAGALRVNNMEEVCAIFEKLEDISIDYALMEKARKVLVVKADYPWDDVGAWSAMERMNRCDKDGNVCAGDPVVLVDTKNSIVLNEARPGEVAVSVVGMENIVVVVTDDAVLVVPKDREQEVKQAVAALKERNARQL